MVNAMHAPMPLIVTLAAELGLALVLGFIASRARLPALESALRDGENAGLRNASMEM